MERAAIEREMRVLCQSKNWRKLVGLIDDGYRGVFVILRILQESETDIVAGELAKKMNVSTARIASALNTLEKKQYIIRECEKNDARKVVIRLTEQGTQALEERKSRISEIIASMLQNLTEEESGTLFNLLNKLLQ